MSAEDEYELIVTPPAARAIAEQLPERVAAAVIEFLTTTLPREPRRVGKPLRRELAGVWSARRGTYRILYRIRDDPREVIVLRVEQRDNVYRPRDGHGNPQNAAPAATATTASRRKEAPIYGAS